MSSPRHRSTTPSSDDESDQRSCSSSRTPTPAPIIDDEQWTSGEFTLISTDGVRFRIPSYVLLNASSVFRDIASLPSEAAAPSTSAPAPEIELTDATIETADVLRIFLSLAATGTLGLEPREVGYFATLFLLKDTIGLCNKYLADGVLHVLKLQIYKLHSEHRGLYAPRVSGGVEALRRSKHGGAGTILTPPQASSRQRPAARSTLSTSTRPSRRCRAATRQVAAAPRAGYGSVMTEGKARGPG